MQAFIDESGTDERAPVVSVAGFSGTQAEWNNFLDIWSPSEFHAKDSDWLFPELCTAIEQSRVNGVVVTVAKECFQAGAGAHFKTALGNAYASCTLVCATHICMGADRPVSFVIEHGQPNVGFVKRTLEALMETENSKIAAVAVAKKPEFVQLHTADFVSHIASSHDVAWMKRLMDAGRLVQAHITREILRDTSEKVSRLFREARRLRRLNRTS